MRRKIIIVMILIYIVTINGAVFAEYNVGDGENTASDTIESNINDEDNIDLETKEDIEPKEEIQENNMQTESVQQKDTKIESHQEKYTKIEAVQKDVSLKASQKQNTRPIEDGYYQIETALNYKKVLDVSGASTENRANIQIWGNDNVKQQKFKVTYNGDGYYTIKSAKSLKVLDVEGGRNASGTNVWQYEENGTYAQKWTIKETSDGFYNIVSGLNSNLNLEVADGIIANGTNIRINDANNSKQQKFSFVKTDVVMAEKTISDGYYAISTKLNSKKVLDVSTASKENGANVQIWDNDNVKQQKFKVTYNGDGYYTIQNVNSGKVLDVAYADAKSGTNIWQYEANGTDAQKWIIKKNIDGTYNIISALNDDLQLDVADSNAVNGTNVRIYKSNTTNSQKFSFVKTDVVMAEKTISDGYYAISTKLDTKKVLDVSTASKENGANVQIWDNDNVKQQKFKVTYNGDGYYTIQNVNSGKVLDVAYADAKSGTNIWQYEANGTDAQKWIIKKNIDGTYNIISALNDDLQLDVADSNVVNGTNIRIYKANTTNSQKFLFTEADVVIPKKTIENGTYKISMKNNTRMALDISTASKLNEGNLQIWSYDNVLQQKFKVTYIGDGYYTIKNINSEKMLDVAYGNAVSGENVWQYEANGTDAQKWIIRYNSDGSYNIIPALNDELQLDVVDGKDSNGTNVRIYKANNTNSQKFIFEKMTAIRLQSGTYGSSGLKVKGDSRGQTLKYYKIGNGPNVFFATFAIHGWEDCFDYDGKELTKIAESFKDKLIEMQDEDLANKWTIYIFPSLNPDGEYYGYTHNGPGRTTLYSAAPQNKGIDMNRCWSTGFRKYTGDRNYNGTEAFQAYEARDLRDFLLNHKATNGQTVLVDLHGWLNETIGDEEIGSYYRSQFGMNKHIATYGQGYLVNWARSNLGSNGNTARSSLVELPEVSNSNQVSDWRFTEKYINATLNMLRGI